MKTTNRVTTSLAQYDQITKAYKFFEKRLRLDPAPKLETLKKVVVSNLVLVSIVLDRDDNPHLIFESLNAKGHPLSQADLIRRKQEIPRNSHLELNKCFGVLLEWNEDAIRRRAESLANGALEVWKYFGYPQEEGSALTRGVTGSKPKAITVLGERFAVSSWREVAQKTLETIAEVDVENFEQIADQFPHFVGRASKRFRAPRQLKNGAFMETNLNADAINKLCIQVVALVGLSSEDWRVEFV